MKDVVLRKSRLKKKMFVKLIFGYKNVSQPYYRQNTVITNANALVEWTDAK